MIVTAAVILENNKVLIARKGSKWEFPGGKVEEGEKMEGCLRREIKEELGTDIEVGEEIGMERDGEIEVHFFTAFLKGNIIAREHEEVKWVNIDELESYDFFNADYKFIENFIKSRNKENEN